MKRSDLVGGRRSAKVRQHICLPAAVFLLTVLCAAGGRDARAEPCEFEDLGEVLRVRALALPFVTKDPAGWWMAWGSHSEADKKALVGVRTDNGHLTWVDLTRFGGSRILMTQAANGNLYAYTGNPGHFVKYDVTRRELCDLGVPARPASYWMGSAVGPDGRFYVGTTPRTFLVRCDPRTDKVENLGPIATDPRQCYLLYPEVSDDNIVYCPVGLHHCELWAVNADTGAKRQILPDALTSDPGTPRVWTGTDGKVYGRAGKREFLCLFDRIEMRKTMPSRRAPNPLAGSKSVDGIRDDGQLVLTDVKTKQRTLVPTRYEGRPVSLYSVTCQRDGRIYGGTVSPASSFCYDPRTGRLTNLGTLTSGRVQVYDTLSHPRGLFLSSYTGGYLDFYDPSQSIEKSRNPRPIVGLAERNMQERPVQLVLGPDGQVYAGTIPVKGHLGGALVRINPDDLSTTVWRDVIPRQSILGLVSVPETCEILCVTTVGGGSSAIATEKEAFAFLWDVKRETVCFRFQPLPHTLSYQSVARAANGVIYGFANTKYFAFDPQNRKVLFTGDLPVKTLHYPGPRGAPVDAGGLIYGLGDDALFAIDPSDHRVKVVARHKSVQAAFGYFVTGDGFLYYGSGSRLMRCRLGSP